MAVHCPYCHHSMHVKGAKPGRYSPRCSKCQAVFALVVPDDPNAPWRVAAVTAGDLAAAAARAEAAAEAAERARALAAAREAAAAQGLPAALAAGDDDPDRTAAGRAALLTGGGDSTVSGRPAIDPTPADATAPAPKPRPIPRGDPAHGGPTPPPPADTAPTSAPPPRPTPPPPSAAAPPHFARAEHGAHTPAGGAHMVLGGYEVIRQIGRGGMGSVYLARQLSLDRNVALKTMHPQWVGDPQFVARFTREAYAAAQLVHHNVVQIYDVGLEQDTHFFSMEFVEGTTLGDLVRVEGKLDPEMAVGYVLQAARGLKFAHDQGMVHRDIKPDNLMVNRHGVVKVADLGLVKTPSSAADEHTAPAGGEPARATPAAANKLSAAAASSATQASVAMGTPAYMAPEQAADAAHVDARADIYSLGCTLYVMVTGRPVHEGNTALEVITKHQTEPIVPPDVVVKRVPRELSAIVLKMTAKKPEERYQNMGEVIGALEDFLGIQSGAPFSPREEHANALERAVHQFNAAPAARQRGWLILGFVGLCALATILAAWRQSLTWAGGFIGLGLLTFVCYQALLGVTQKTHLFLKLRQLVFGARILDFLAWAGGLAALVFVLWLVGLLGVWLAFLVAAALLAGAFHLVIDRRLNQQRQPPAAAMEDMLKSMRLRGLEEAALRHFVCRYSGERWEEFYEALFGYEAKLVARQQWGRGPLGRPRKKHAGWRDPVVAWIENRLRQRQEQREKRMLQRTEEKALRARGLSDADARHRAEVTAAIMVDKAGRWACWRRRRSPRRPAARAAPPSVPRRSPTPATTPPASASSSASRPTAAAPPGPP